MPELTDNKDKKYAVLYSPEQQMADEAQFEKNINEGKVDFSNFRRIMLKDILNNSELIETGYLGKVKLEDVQRAMEHPRSSWRTLIRASETLMHISPHYYRLNSLFANMALFCWWIDLYDVRDNANVETIKKQYGTLAARLENMHLKHEFSKIMRTLPYQDVYYGALQVVSGSRWSVQLQAKPVWNQATGA